MDTIMRTEPALASAAFVERVIIAVLPLVDPDDKEQLRKDVGDAEVYAVLKPIFADYTVEDAVAASFTIKRAMKAWEKPRYTPDRFEAACQARDLLQDFICKARPSSPDCASARSRFLIEESCENSGTLADANTRPLYEALAQDIDCLRRNDFTSRANKRRFGGAKWYAH